jgi:hypothetical protein
VHSVNPLPRLIFPRGDGFLIADAHEIVASRLHTSVCNFIALSAAVKLQEVLLRATSGKIKWRQAAELIGISERQMRRWRTRYEAEGYEGLLDRRLRKPSSRRVPKKQADDVLSLYRDRYFDLNVRHFHEAAERGPPDLVGVTTPNVKNRTLRNSDHSFEAAKGVGA